MVSSLYNVDLVGLGDFAEVDVLVESSSPPSMPREPTRPLFLAKIGAIAVVVAGCLAYLFVRNIFLFSLGCVELLSLHLVRTAVSCHMALLSIGIAAKVARLLRWFSTRLSAVLAGCSSVEFY